MRRRHVFCKVDTLRLATKYIRFLAALVNKTGNASPSSNDDPTTAGRRRKPEVEMGDLQGDHVTDLMTSSAVDFLLNNASRDGYEDADADDDDENEVMMYEHSLDVSTSSRSCSGGGLNGCRLRSRRRRFSRVQRRQHRPKIYIWRRAQGQGFQHIII